jgi:hypothetical protein
LIVFENVWHDGGVGVCFVFLMAIGDGGFNKDASMADFEERLLM